MVMLKKEMCHKRFVVLDFLVRDEARIGAFILKLNENLKTPLGQGRIEK